jgi:hypothetical protein
MNKQLAKAQSIAGKLTVGELRALIAKGRQRGGVSRVNAAIPMDVICGIYEGALAGREDSEAPKGTTYDVYRRCDRPSKDSLTICNILRDCA